MFSEVAATVDFWIPWMQLHLYALKKFEALLNWY